VFIIALPLFIHSRAYVYVS